MYVASPAEWWPDSLTDGSQHLFCNVAPHSKLLSQCEHTVRATEREREYNSMYYYFKPTPKDKLY